jgi:hypothetical protein
MAKFAKGHAHNPRSGRPKGSPNKGTVRERKLISQADDAKIVKQVVEAAKAGDRPAWQIYFRFLRPAPSRAVTFAAKTIELRKVTTLEEAGEETLRVTAAVAAGELDHDTGSFIISAVRTFMDTLGAVKAEQEDARADVALKLKDGA